MIYRWMMKGRFSRFIPVVMVVVLFVSLYILTAARMAVNYADSDDLTLSIFFGGLAHPPGYPLLILIYRALTSFLPFSLVIVKVNLLTAVLQGAGVGLFYLLVRLILFKVYSHEDNLATTVAVIVSLWYGSSLQTWTHATVVEVFPLELLFLLGFLILNVFSMRRWAPKSRRVLHLGAGVLAGLAFFHHQLGALAILPLWLVFWRKIEGGRRFLVWQMVTAGMMFGGLFVLYRVIPIAEAAYTWNVSREWEGVLRFFLRLSYVSGGSQIETYARSFDLIHITRSVGILLGKTFEEMGIGIFLTFLVGVWWVICKKGRIERWLLISLLISGPLLVVYLKFPLREMVTDVEYYWGLALRMRMYYVFNLVAYLIAAIGLYVSGVRFVRKVNRNRLVISVVLISVLGFSGWRLWSRYELVDVSDANLNQLYTQRVLQSLPDGAVLFVDGDVVFGFLEQQMIERVREDLLIIPVGIGVRNKNSKHAMKEVLKFDNVDAYSTRALAEEVVNLVSRGSRVFMYNPSTTALELIGVEGNPYYAKPYGYVIEVATDPGGVMTVYDYGLSKQLVDRSDHDFDWWVSGIKGHLATIHTQMAYYYARMGDMERAQTHRGLALGLVDLPVTVKEIDRTVSEAIVRYEKSESYMGYKPLVYEDYVRLSRRAMVEGNANSAIYYLERAVMLSPEKFLARVELIDLYKNMSEVEKMELELSMFTTF